MSTFFCVGFLALAFLPSLVGRRAGRPWLRDWLCLALGASIGLSWIPSPSWPAALVLLALAARTLRRPPAATEGYVSLLGQLEPGEDREAELAEAAELAVMTVHHEHAVLTLAEELTDRATSAAE